MLTAPAHQKKIPITLLQFREENCDVWKKKTYLIICLMIICYLPGNALARVSGLCSDCHTMHHSQTPWPSEWVSSEPNPSLLVNDCVGCHTGTNDASNTTPYVLDTLAPTFGAGGNTLAGGNFYWVKTDDTKGHNVFLNEGDDFLSKAPGDSGHSTCATNSCHANLHLPVSGMPIMDPDGQALPGGEYGCRGCHLKVKHHANDGPGTKYVDSASQGWYRFLAGHYSGAGFGVAGIEHERWNFGATASLHNEYQGFVSTGSPGGFGAALGNTATAFCTGCHGVFHSDQQSGGSWIRHPSDAVIPNSGEYQYAFGAAGGGASGTYNPDVPVARPSTFAGWATDTPSDKATPGVDMVMCLSCHVAHGSRYPDLLRWDYRGSPTGGYCSECHTTKD